MNLLIVDDEAAVRAGLIELFESCEELRVIGEASIGREALLLAFTARF